MSVQEVGADYAVTSAPTFMLSEEGKGDMAAKTPPIRILELTPLDSRNVKALLRVKVGDLVFLDCRLVFPNADTPPTVSPPMHCWLEPDGKRRYRILCQWPRHVRQAVNEAAFRAYQKEQGRLIGGEQ